MKASKDFKDSAEAVAKAIGVLNDYYSQASFVQAIAVLQGALCPVAGHRHRFQEFWTEWTIIYSDHAGEAGAGARRCELGRRLDDRVGAGGR